MKWWLNTLKQLVIIAAMMLAYGFCFSLMWRWFAEPLGAPRISVALGVGIFLMVRFMVVPFRSKEDKSMHPWTRKALTVLFPFAILGLAWCVRFFL